MTINENDFIKFINEQMQRRNNVYNNAPSEMFDGLSPVDMSRLLYKSIDESDSICTLNTTIPNELIQNAIFVKDMRLFLTLIQEKSPLKLTQVGYLPPAICRELAESGVLDDETWWYNHKKPKIVRETDFQYINLIHTAATLFRLAKKRAGKLSLTKNGKQLLADSPQIHFYNHIIKEYMVTLNWGYPDGYPDALIVQKSVLFSLHLLQKYGSKPHDTKFYAKKFSEAFPAAIREFPGTGYSPPEDQLERCFGLRVFERCFRRFGLINAPQQEGYKVIRINIDFFNEKERGLKIEDKNHFSINISAKFPLNVEKKLESDAGDGIIKRIGTLTKQKNSKVVIMNAISDRNYPGILKVVKSTHAIYIKSYLAMTLDPEHVKIYKRNEDGELFWQTHTEDVHLLNSDLNNFIQFANYA